MNLCFEAIQVILMEIKTYNCGEVNHHKVNGSTPVGQQNLLWALYKLFMAAVKTYYKPVS